MALAEREITPQTQKRFHTEAEYLALEEAAEFKSEYVNREIEPMSGGTDYHGIISVNVTSELRAALRGRGCAVMPSDVKVRANGQMYYPDASVTCGPRQYYSGNHTVITNPLLVAEVLSPSTEQKDRGEKFQNYRAVESLATYLLVSQDKPLMEQFSRAENGHWDYQAVAGLEGVLTIPALSVSLNLADIYDEIEFGQEAGMSSAAHEYHVSAAGVGEMLTGGGEFLPPQRLLGDLTEAQALAVPPGSLYSIAQIVAHMHFWQEHNIARGRGDNPPRPEHLDDTFPSVGPGEWDALRRVFLAGLGTCAQTAAEKADATSPDRDDNSIGYDLAECPALHSAYHYGQIAMLRQIQGWWPPEGGDDSW